MIKKTKLKCKECGQNIYQWNLSSDGDYFLDEFVKSDENKLELFYKCDGCCHEGSIYLKIDEMI